MIYWRSNERLAYSVGKRKEKISFEYNFLLNRFSYKFSLIPKSSITFFWIFVCLIDVQGPAAFVSSCLKKLCSLFMDRVQLSQDYRVILKRHYFPRNFWYSFDWPLKDERLSWPWNHLVLVNTGPLNLGSKIKTNSKTSMWNDPWLKDVWSMIFFN